MRLTDEERVDLADALALAIVAKAAGRVLDRLLGEFFERPEVRAELERIRGYGGRVVEVGKPEVS